MFHNYFFLRRLAAELDESLKSSALLACFSQNKDELILGFAQPKQEVWMRANLDPQVSLIQFPDEFHRARKNSVDLFGEILGQPVSGVGVFSYERSFQIAFENGLSLIFKMHGSRSNILLANADQVLSIFRNQLPNDLQLTPGGGLHQYPALDEKAFAEADGNPARYLPALGKEVAQWLRTEGYEKKPLKEKWTLMQQTLRHLHHHPIVFTQDPPALWLLPVHTPHTAFPSAIAACNQLYEAHTRTFYLRDAKNQALRTLQNQISKTENYLRKTTEKLEEVRQQRGYDELANILMANLHQIPTRAERVTLTDFYTNEPITIKLNPTQTAQQVAENFYRKAKNQRIEIEKLEENLAERQRQLEALREKLVQIETSEQVKAVRALSPEKVQREAEKTLPYHHLEYEGFEILIGKNAKANDELTLKVANKDDLWLHARDVPGSHVVVRQRAGKPFPKNVIERAAELAAWYSKRKTDSLCPVIYTPKKYVRKVKGTAPGQVRVEKESVVMVTPRG